MCICKKTSNINIYNVRPHAPRVRNYETIGKVDRKIIVRFYKKLPLNVILVVLNNFRKKKQIFKKLYNI